MSDWNVRFAEPTDAAAFADWAAHNPQIDPADLEAGMMKNNPTVLTFVVTKNDVPVVFAPLYLTATLAHLGFNPATSGASKLKALSILQDGVSAFMVQFGIREIQTLSMLGYGIAKWATEHGFEVDARAVYRLDLNKQMQP